MKLKFNISMYACSITIQLSVKCLEALQTVKSFKKTFTYLQSICKFPTDILRIWENLLQIPAALSEICCRYLTIIIHQTHYEKSDWSRAFNQFTIACELDMINAISAADIAFIRSSSTSAWLPSPLECSPLKQNG